jgi:WXG100 family type VII secretion target
MKNNNVRVDYQELDDIIGQFDKLEQQLQDTFDDVRRTMDRLYDGWKGKAADAFFDEMDADVMPRFRRTTEAMGASSHTLRLIVNIMADAEQRSRAYFGLGGGLPRGKMPYPGSTGSLTYQNGQWRISNDDHFSDYHKKHYRQIPFHGSRIDLYYSYIEGNMSLDEALRQAAYNPFAQKPVDVRGVLWDQYAIQEDSLFSAKVAGEYGALEGRLMGYENMSGLQIGYEDGTFGLTGRQSAEAYGLRMGGNLDAGGVTAQGQMTFGEAGIQNEATFGVGAGGIQGRASSEGGLYLMRMEADAQYAGWEVAVDGRVGAEYSLDAEAAFDPTSGDAYVASGGQVRAGGFVEGSVSKEFGFLKAGVRGEASYGLGAGYEGRLGVKDGIFRADLNGFLTAGGGLGGGGFVEIDLREAGDDIAETGRNILDVSERAFDEIAEDTGNVVDGLANTARFLGYL